MSEKNERIEKKCSFMAGGFVAPDTNAIVVLFMKGVIVFTTTIVSSEPSGSPLETVQNLADEFEGSIEDFEVKVYALYGEIHGRDLGKQ